MSDIALDVVKEAFPGKWYKHEQLVVLTKDIGEYKAGRIGRINVVYNTKNRSLIGIHFFGDEPDDVNICSPITQNPPDLVEYCEPIAESDPRVLADKAPPLSDGQLVTLSCDLADLKAGMVGRVRHIPTTPPSICVEFPHIEDEYILSREADGAVVQVVDYCTPLSEDSPMAKDAPPPHTEWQRKLESVTSKIWRLHKLEGYLDGLIAHKHLLLSLGKLFMSDKQYQQMEAELAEGERVARADFEQYKKAIVWLHEVGDLVGFWTFFESLGTQPTRSNPFHEIGARIGAVPPIPTSRKEGGQ